jgi:hypothetical protein
MRTCGVVYISLEEKEAPMPTKEREAGLRISVPVSKEEQEQIRKISSITGIPAAIIFKASVAKMFPGLFKEHAEIRLDMWKDILKSK